MSRLRAAFVLQGNSSFNVLTGFNNELMLCLRRMEIEPVVLNLVEWQSAIPIIDATLKKYGASHVIGAFSFSGIGMALGNDTPFGNVWQRLKIPALSWMMDLPCYYLDRHSFIAPAVGRLYPTMDSIDFQRAYVKAKGRNLLCRLGAFTQGQPAQRREPQKGEAPLILFPKSLADDDLFRRKWSALPSPIKKALNDAADHYWDETPRYGIVLPSVLKAARANGMELENDLDLLCFLVSHVDHYFRARKATILIKELLPLPVRIYGDGIGHIDTKGARADVRKPIDYDELTAVYREALAVVSMNPNADDGCHDRNFHAFGAGALPLSDTSPWWEKKYPELAPYSFDFRDRHPAAAVEKVLAAPQDAADLAWKVGEKARAERTFQDAVAEAVDYALMQRYFEFEFETPLDIYVRPEQ